MHSVDPVVASVASRFARIRAGLAAGYGASSPAEALKAARGGVWAETDETQDMPFEDCQFDAVAMASAAVCREAVREANRVLKPDGCLFFTVAERTGKQEGYTAPEIYRLVREGFDIVELKRPEWWRFGRGGKTFTVCARKKAWREHKGFMRDGSLPFTPFRSRT